MENIEKSLDHFFKELKHTPGSWWKPQYESEVMEGPRGDIKICRIHAVSEKDDGSHNGKLIAQAPDLLRSTCRTYLWMLVKFAYGINDTCTSIRISASDTLASLRNQISNATGLECEYIQDTFEQYALWINLDEEIPTHGKD